MNNDKAISLVEQQEIVDNLFKKYLSKININNLTWGFEGHAANTTALTFKELSIATKSNESIGGSYIGELPFLINYQILANENADLDSTNPLNQLAIIFENETKNKFPNLKLNNFTPLSIKMTGVTEITNDKENNIKKYSATYMLRYKSKGWY